jgi:hypothetical protein
MISLQQHPATLLDCTALHCTARHTISLYISIIEMLPLQLPLPALLTSLSPHHCIRTNSVRRHQLAPHPPPPPQKHPVQLVPPSCGIACAKLVTSPTVSAAATCWSITLPLPPPQKHPVQRIQESTAPPGPESANPQVLRDLYGLALPARWVTGGIKLWCWGVLAGLCLGLQFRTGIILSATPLVLRDLYGISRSLPHTLSAATLAWQMHR